MNEEPRPIRLRLKTATEMILARTFRIKYFEDCKEVFIKINMEKEERQKFKGRKDKSEKLYENDK